MRGLVTLPMVLPPVVGGIALLLAFGRRGLLGAWLYDSFGLTFPFTTAGVVMAETFVAMPFLVVTVEGALRSADAGLEEAAATLGAVAISAFAADDAARIKAGTESWVKSFNGGNAGHAGTDTRAHSRTAKPDRGRAGAGRGRRRAAQARRANSRRGGAGGSRTGGAPDRSRARHCR